MSQSVFQIACVQHFSTEPLSFMLGQLLAKEDSKVASMYYICPLCGYHVYNAIGRLHSSQGA